MWTRVTYKLKLLDGIQHAKRNSAQIENNNMQKHFSLENNIFMTKYFNI